MFLGLQSAICSRGGGGGVRGFSGSGSLGVWGVGFQGFGELKPPRVHISPAS